MAGPSADAYLCHRRLSLRSGLLRLRVVQHHDWRTSVTNQPFRDLNPRRCRASPVLRRPVRHLVGGHEVQPIRRRCPLHRADSQLDRPRRWLQFHDVPIPPLLEIDPSSGTEASAWSALPGWLIRVGRECCLPTAVGRQHSMRTSLRERGTRRRWSCTILGDLRLWTSGWRYALRSA